MAESWNRCGSSSPRRWKGGKANGGHKSVFATAPKRTRYLSTTCHNGSGAKRSLAITALRTWSPQDGIAKEQAMTPNRKKPEMVLRDGPPPRVLVSCVFWESRGKTFSRSAASHPQE